MHEEQRPLAGCGDAVAGQGGDMRTAVMVIPISPVIWTAADKNAVAVKTLNTRRKSHREAQNDGACAGPTTKGATRPQRQTPATSTNAIWILRGVAHISKLI